MFQKIEPSYGRVDPRAAAKPNFLQYLYVTLAICLLTTIAGQAAGAQTMTAELWQNQAEHLRLAEQRQWQRLGHWRARTRGHISDIDGPGFFLAPDGKLNPLSELRATLTAFAEPVVASASAHAQCRFLARRSWLFEQLKVDKKHWLECQEMNEWKRKLGAEQVALVFASAYMNNAASMFGHTFLKFESAGNTGDRDLLNYGVSFLARTGNDGGVPYALYGLLGAYPGSFSLQPFHETLREYSNLEGRDIWEYRLGFSKDEIDRLIDHLIELQQTYFDYYFLDENCSYQLLAALEVARPSLELTDQFFWAVIPADTIRLVSKQPGLVTMTKFRPSSSRVFQDSLISLSLSERSLVQPLALGKASDDLNLLPAARQAAVLDSALLLNAQLSVKDPLRYQKQGHHLKLLRAQNGAIRPLPPITEPPPRPEIGHDSGQIALGLGARNTERFEELQFRFAYHHLLSSDAGFLAGTQLEILKFSLRHQQADNRVSLHEAVFLELLSTAPSDRFFQPLAWRVDIGLRRLADRPISEEPAASANGGVGFAYDLNGNHNLLPWSSGRVRAFALLQGHGDAGASLRHGHRFGASLQAQLLAYIDRRLRINIGVEARDYGLGARSSFSSVWARGSVSLTRNLELRAESRTSAQQREIQAGLFSHFMF